MFTGLVQKLGSVRASVADGYGGFWLTVAAAGYDNLALGESIAINGCCLTLTDFDDESLQFQVGPETAKVTVLGSLKEHDRVNLERALRLGDAVGGHIVTGHVDAVGKIRERKTSGDWQSVRFDCPESLDDLLVHKGSIAVDGVSLTVVDAVKGSFSVMLIPHTLAHTTLGFKETGDAVNLETDLLAKHVKKLFSNLTIEL